MSNYTKAKQVIKSVKYAKHIIITIRKGRLVTNYPREDAGGLSREYVLRIPSVS